MRGSEILKNSVGHSFDPSYGYNSMHFIPFKLSPC